MKNKLYFSDIIKIEKELQRLVNGRIQNIYDLSNNNHNEHCYLIKITITSLKRETVFIIIKPGYYLYEIKNPPTWRRKIPSSFCQKMRSHFKNKRINEISHFGNDRIIRIFTGEGTTQNCLVIELFGEGNISITDHNNLLLSFIYPHRYGGYRLKVNQPHPAWNTERRGIYRDDFILEKIPKIIEFIENNKKDTHFLKIITNHLGKDISSELNHILIKNYQNNDKPENLLKILTNIINSILNSKESVIIDNKNCLPYIYHYLNFDTKSRDNIKVFYKFGTALENYLEKYLPNNSSDKPMITTLKDDPIHQKKERAILDSNQKQVNELTSKINKLRRNVNLMENNKEEFCEKLKILDENTVVTGREHLVVLRVNGNDISIRADKSYYDNLSIKYQNIKYLNKRLNKVKMGLEKGLFNINKFNKVNKTKKVVLDTKINLVTNKWYQEYYWFYTTNSFLVICGKNSTHNETIVKKMMEINDIYLHSEIPGSGSALIKNPDKKSITPSDLEQAGTFVICHSNAWKANVIARPYWVKPEQVSKTTNSGEYITKGSFIIRGKRNYLSLPELILGVTLCNNQLMIAPYSTIINMGKKIKLFPGRQKRNLVLNKIIKYFNIDVKYKNIIDESLPYFIRC